MAEQAEGIVKSAGIVNFFKQPSKCVNIKRVPVFIRYNPLLLISPVKVPAAREHERLPLFYFE